MAAEARADAPTTLPHRGRLGVVHLLGCMLGCGVVLAMIRVAGPKNPDLSIQLRQLGLGLAYGTAISGLVLYVWRWWTASGPGPSQPGHWLILFCGIGFLIDISVTSVLEPLRMLGLLRWDRGFLHESVGWWIASLIGLIVLLRLKDASRLWIAAAAGIVLALMINAVASTVAVVAMAQGSRGSWPWYAAVTAHLVGTAIALPLLWIAAGSDVARRLHRDWLHVGGLCAVSLLGSVDFAIILYWVTR